MSRPRDDFVPLQAALPAVVTDLLKRGPMSAEKLTFAWRTCVGSNIARATTLHWNPGGVVRVVASDERWQREIQRSAAMILRRLQSLLGPGAVSHLDVVAARPESRAPNPGPRPPSWTPPSS